MSLRIVEGLSGRVAMRMELVIRFDYGSIVPWVRRVDDTLLATAGPDTLELRTPVAVRGENMKTVAEFHVSEGERVPFALNYRPSHEAAQHAVDPEQALAATEKRVAQMVRALHLPGPLARCRRALADHAEGADLRAHRRNRRGAHDFVAGATGRRAQLGLPLLLAARRHVHVERAAARRLSRRGGRLARVAVARRGGLSRRSADPLQRHG